MSDSGVDAIDAKAEVPSSATDAEGELPSGSSMEFEQVDAKLTRLSLYGSTSSAVAVDDEESKYRYRMDHKRRGYFIIINNRDFAPHTGMNSRTGTDVDAQNLYQDFKKLGFSVTVHLNQTSSQMLQIMIEAARKDHSDCDCFGVAVLSHGDNSVLYGTDNIITVDDLVAPIKSCRSLSGKPKIFIFQACRGTELDSGLETTDAQSEGPERVRRIPLEADFLYAYSTVPGYFSWRNSSKGSWFVQALHKMMEKYIFNMDFCRLLTRVNHEVSYEFESNAAQPHMNRKKQVPSVVSMLTKDLYFTPKKDY